jgi:capsule polysaccharide export protein KpsE/RkpR
MTNQEDKRAKIIDQKIKLSEDVLQVAEEALKNIRMSMADAQVRDLVSIFTSAVKVHRDLVSDVASIEEKEVSSKQEKQLAKEYTSKVDELLKKISQQ